MHWGKILSRMEHGITGNGFWARGIHLQIMSSDFWISSRRLILGIFMHGITGGRHLVLRLYFSFKFVHIQSNHFYYLVCELFPRFVAALMNRSEEDELKYTDDMINNNFSNYSAWHNRRYDWCLLIASQLKHSDVVYSYHGGK